MSNCFIILAAGKGKRFKSKIPKQFAIYKKKPLYKHSIEKIIKSGLFKYIILVVNNKKFIKEKYPKNVKIIKGGKERNDSSFLGLKLAKKLKIKNVLIHDAARPNFSINLVKKLLNNLKKHNAVIPHIKAKDSIKYKYKNSLFNLQRENLIMTQTPQAFKFKFLYLLSENNKSNIQDESSLFIEKDLKIKFIPGDNENLKITFNNDIKEYENSYGIGFDIHRLVLNKKLYLGGIKVKSRLGTLGHSDGDPVLHAIIDSLLGACKMGDIGEKFSNKNKKYKNIRSTILLKKIINQIKLKNYRINNIDINIITEKPKISNLKKKMIHSISHLCEIYTNQINIKGKTTEKLGLIGKEKAIACEVITSLNKYE